MLLNFKNILSFYKANWKVFVWSPPPYYFYVYLNVLSFFSLIYKNLYIIWKRQCNSIIYSTRRVLSNVYNFYRYLIFHLVINVLNNNIYNKTYTPRIIHKIFLIIKLVIILLLLLLVVIKLLIILLLLLIVFIKLLSILLLLCKELMII